MESKLNVDYEWIYLMLKAKEIGCTTEEIKEFLTKKMPEKCVEQY
ncbi:anti-repressor SinI family protein [Gracilibacillus caseinilyticus]|uniref:Anti-repressor SinI family protein n=1 Tax=Gracilibacillus caseinilyticus TaxID=2932256 RepID=A0ABY4EUG4_9BACI|nr:DNA-binding anti-repressor SinI [Gracilibacillus caseinilyticus]UOQ47279.1 anti-repressor SinI family protein [Gracilibacillus caseinilyticus]